MDPILWDISDRARAAWRTTTVPRGSQFFNIFGTGFETAYDVEYGSLEAPIAKPSDITSGNPVRRFTWIDGDSTVPLCCAVSGVHMGICMHGRIAKVSFHDILHQPCHSNTGMDTAAGGGGALRTHGRPVGSLERHSLRFQRENSSSTSGTRRGCAWTMVD